MSHQHGFVNEKSCLSNVLKTFDTIIEFLGENQLLISCT